MKNIHVLLITLIALFFSCQETHQNSTSIVFKIPNEEQVKLYYYLDINDTVNIPIKNNTATLEIQNDQYFFITYKEKPYSLYVTPNSKTTVFINEKNEIHFEGDHQKINNLLAFWQKKYPTNLPSIQTSDYHRIIAQKDSIERKMISHLTNSIEKKDRIVLEKVIHQKAMNDAYINFLFNKDQFHNIDKYPPIFFEIQDFILNNSNQVLKKDIYSFVSLTFYQSIYIPAYLKEKGIQPSLENILSVVSEQVQNAIVREVLEEMIIKESLTSNGNNLESKKAIASFYREYPQSIYIPSIKKLSSQKEVLGAGQVAKGIIGYGPNGNKYNLLDNQDNILVIDVWATWCPGCIENLPTFLSLEQKMANQDVSFIKLSVDHDKEKWNSFKRYNLNQKSFIIPDNSSFREDYQIAGIPRYIVIDKDKKIINAYAKLDDLESIILKTMNN